MEPIGYAWDGAIRCPECTPARRRDDDETGAVFGDSETDSPTHCDACGELVPEALTAEGVGYVAESLRAAREERIRGAACRGRDKRGRRLCRGCPQCVALGTWRDEYGAASGPLSDEATAPRGALATLGPQGSAILRALLAAAAEARRSASLAQECDEWARARRGLDAENDPSRIAGMADRSGAVASLSAIAEVARELRAEAGLPL
jgi:hypothetical protein